MTITIAIVFASIIALLFFLFLAARGRSAPVADITQLQGRTQPVDLLAFRNLTDPAEEEYLRHNLAPKDFRRVQRQRLKAAIAYLDSVGANAAVLLRLGEAAHQSTNPEVAQAGLRLANEALRVRLYATSARARFYMALLLPGVHVSPAAVSGLYEQLTGTASTLGHLQNSSRRVSAVL